jgi:hypothetical protein
MDVMASIKGTHNSSGIFSKLKVVVAFLKYAKVVVASIQLTLDFLFCLQRTLEPKVYNSWISCVC